MTWAFAGVLILTITNVLALPSTQEKIVGGSLTSITQYPYAVAMLDFYFNYGQNCGGTILTENSVLTAAHCVLNAHPLLWRVRVGSSFGNSGGSVHHLNNIITHPDYNPLSADLDVGIVYTEDKFEFNRFVQKGVISGPNYPLGDNEMVIAVGWGTQWSGGPSSEQLRHVQYWTVNREVCRTRYNAVGSDRPITDNMLCAGWLDVGGRDQCQGDSGGPLIHNGVVVGVCSFGLGCAEAEIPGVNVLVSSVAEWIRVAA